MRIVLTAAKERVKSCHLKTKDAGISLCTNKIEYIFGVFDPK